MMPDKFFFVAIVMAILLFVLGVVVGHTHERHLSDMGTQTNVTAEVCSALGGYLMSSDQNPCFVVYKHVDLEHSGIHVQPIKVNEDGECVCPTGE